ncbi:interferon regulatory factor 8-like isoform X2 [Liolophura sinensis]
MSGDGRQRLRPWLQSKLNSGNIPGVQWKDRAAGIFQLPWKHGGKQDWSENDSLIFKEWAIHTGRFREGIDKEDWSTWKTRLRCALNKLPDIQEMKELSKLEEPSPYRVYRFLPLKPGVDSTSPKAHLAKTEEIVQAVVPLQSSFEETPQNIPTTVTGQILGRSMSSQSEEMTMEVDPDTTRSQTTADFMMSRDDLVVEESVYPTDTYTGAPMGCFGQEPPPFVGPTVSQPLQFDQAGRFAFQTVPEDHELQISLKFRGVTAQKFWVGRREGCRLYYGPDSDGSSLLGDTGVEIYGPKDVQQLKMPACPDQDETTEHLTSKLLNVLDRGLVLEVVNGDVYATRLCRCVIFAQSPSLTKSLGTPHPLRLKRDSPKEKIFDFNGHFMPELQQYCNGQGPPPSPELLVSFGQKWNPQTQDVRSLLISATITHCKALYFLKQAAVRGIPSLHISSEDAYDAYVKEVKELVSGNWSMMYDPLPGTPQPV